MTGIWVSEHVADDHRKVIDWLNDNTPPTISLYLAQVQAYRIGDSPVAPQLDVVSRPNVQTKIRRGDADPDLKERHIWRKDFWEEILGYIKDQKPPFRVQSPGTDAWTNIAIGRAQFTMGLTLTPKRQCIGCELYVSPSWKEEAFAQLQAQREVIEGEIGESLQWLSLADKKVARILLEAPIDPRDPQNRDQVKKWMYKQAMAFYKAFHARVKALKPSVPRLAEPDAGEE
jgi:hypothetical protein